MVPDWIKLRDVTATLHQPSLDWQSSTVHKKWTPIEKGSEKIKWVEQIKWETMLYIYKWTYWWFVWRGWMLILLTDRGAGLTDQDKKKKVSLNLHQTHHHPRWCGIPVLRCGGMEGKVRPCLRRARGNARGWGCCWGSVWGWWPAACALCPPSTCASREREAASQSRFQVNLLFLGYKTNPRWSTARHLPLNASLYYSPEQ